MTVVVQPSDRRLGRMLAGTANGVTTQQQQQNQAITTPNGQVVIGSGTILTAAPSGTPAAGFGYLFNNSLVDEDPGVGYMAFNALYSGSATAIYLDNVNYEGGNVAKQLAAVPVGSTVTVSVESDTVTYTVGSVTASTFVTLGVTYTSGVNTEFPSNAECELMVTSAPRYGMTYFDQFGVLQMQADQFGIHMFANESESSAGPAVYVADLLPSSWVPLTLASGVGYESGSPVPSARIDPAGIVRLKGQLKNTSGGTIDAETTIATVPSEPIGLLPYWPVQLVAVVPSEAATLNVGFNGAMTLNGNWLSNELCCLDGVTYTID